MFSAQNLISIGIAVLLTAGLYAIMSYGMRQGSFTGKKLSTYIYSAGCDYQQARRIINGTDQAAKIAGYAERLELILRASCNSSFSSCF